MNKEESIHKAIREANLLGIEHGKAQRDMEVKQAIEELLKELKIRRTTMTTEFGEQAMSKFIEYIEELLQKLGLGK